MITYDFKPSFRRTVRKLPIQKQQQVKSLSKHLVWLLSKGENLPKGMGLTRLHKNYWEIRTTIKERVLFHYQKNQVDFILAGNHNDVKKFLKSK